MADYENKETSIEPAKVINIPETVTLPDLRYAFPSGTLAKGDLVVCNFRVTDKDGIDKVLPVSRFRVRIKEWPADPQQEILAVSYLHFVIANKSEKSSEEA